MANSDRSPKADPGQRVRVATVWLCGCSGCHMALLDLDEKLLDLAALVDFVASPIMDVKQFPECDVALVEGAVGTSADLETLKVVRQRSRLVVALGDCAAMAGVPTLRNAFSLTEVLERAYVEAESNATLIVPDQDVPGLLSAVRPIHAYVEVNAFVPGCPPSVEAIWNALQGLLGREPSPVELRYD